MAKNITELVEVTELATTDQAILRKGNFDRRISLELAGTLAWAKRNGYTSLGNHAVGISFANNDSFTIHQGQTYFVREGVTLPYTSTSTDPSTEAALYLKVEQAGVEVLAENLTGWGNSINLTLPDITQYRFLMLQGTLVDGVTGAAGRVWTTVYPDKVVGVGHTLIGSNTRGSGITGYSAVGLNFTSNTTATTRVVFRGDTFDAAVLGIYGVR
ncbi:hypothetical protein VP501E541_P0065 [Vibrio phage 501E54-1]|nr:hypothetical protein VP501E541_P0065 [Vibrio phage 501E54-1]